MSHQEIAIERFGPADNLVVRDVAAASSIGDNEVAIAVKYSGINFADIHMRLGFYPDAPRKPFVPGYEVSGHVDAVGRNVKHLAPGDPVVAGTYFGGYASRVTIPAQQVFPLPNGLELAEGAAMPVAFFTAHVALAEMGRVRAGDRVLIECATGGVGTLAVQLARRAGAEVVGLTTSESKKAYITELGATAYTRDEFYADESLAGFDFILNASGGKHVKRQMTRLGITGRMVCIGLSSGIKDGKRSLWRIAVAAVQTPRVSVLKLFDQNRGVFGLNVLRVLQDDAWIARMTGALASVDGVDLRPRVDKVFEAAEVAAAHEYLESKRARGKVLIGW